MHTTFEVVSGPPCYREVILVRHVAKRLNMPERTVRHLALTKRLPATRIGKKIWAFTLKDVESYRLRKQLSR